MAASNTRFTQSSLANQKIPLTVITVSTATKAGVHTVLRRDGSWPMRRARSRTMPLIGFLGLSSPDAFSPRLAAFSAWRYPIKQRGRPAVVAGGCGCISLHLAS